jgi:predicted metal-dependent peptidase
MLNDFVQEEICDYSFSPPDRRFSESVFFLPDFNDTEVKVENVLFMVDTSASITDEMIRVAYSEIKGAIDQFEGKLSGMLGFFDTSVYGPYAFDGITDVTAIRPKGGGGTSFYSVFEAVQGMEQIPASIVILTDGYAHFPPESMAQDIPVLWLINNEDIAPPWGTVARMQV